jgi:uncharacterized protein involved in cysteine biosynthesis
MRCRRFVIILVRVLVALITIQIRILVQQLQDYLSIRTKHARNVLTHLSTVCQRIIQVIQVIHEYL